MSSDKNNRPVHAHNMLQRAESIRQRPNPEQLNDYATYTVTFGSCNIGALSQPKKTPQPECYVCAYAHYRKSCPLLRCPSCGQWGHNRIDCPSTPNVKPPLQAIFSSPGHLKRAEALLFASAEVNKS